MLRFYLFVNAYTQENHEGILHEAFDHGTNVEKLENHGDLHNAVHPEQQDDYTAYSLDMHNMHEVHDGTNFLMEDHPEEHPAWNFMEDSAGNKVVEEGITSPKTKQPGAGFRPGSPAAQMAVAGRRPTGASSGNNRAGCTSNVAQAQLLANTIIGMITQSNQMMGQLVRMFQIQVVPQPNIMQPFGTGFGGGRPGFGGGRPGFGGNPGFGGGQRPAFGGNPGFGGNPNTGFGGNPAFGGPGTGFGAPGTAAATGPGFGSPSFGAGSSPNGGSQHYPY